MTIKQTYDKLLPIVATIDKSVTCSSVLDNGDGTYTFDCVYTKWAIAGYDITILSDTYKIVEVENNTSITVSGPILPTVLTFDIYPPHFKHGTIKRVANEISQKEFEKDRLPLIFLHETVEEREHFDASDSVQTDADCRIYFLTSCDYSNWDQRDGDTLAIAPMRSLCREFILALVNYTAAIGELSNTGTVRNYNIVGVTEGKGGVENNMFNETLSGVSLRITIPFLRDCECCELSGFDPRQAPGYVLDSNGNVLAILYSNEIYVVSGTGPCADVTIKNFETGDTITTVPAGGTYEVTVLTEVFDTVDANTATIIENLN